MRSHHAIRGHPRPVAPSGGSAKAVPRRGAWSLPNCRGGAPQRDPPCARERGGRLARSCGPQRAADGPGRRRRFQFLHRTLSSRARPREHARAGRAHRREDRHPERARTGHDDRRLGAARNGKRVKRTRLLLADDHRMVLEGLRGLLAAEFDVAGLVEDGRALLEASARLRPDVIVTDITMPGLNGLEAIAALKRNDPNVRVVVITMHREIAYARRALQAGASGFVLKSSAPGELAEAIRSAVAGRTFVTPEIAGEMTPARERSRPAAGVAGSLTPRQREILQLLAAGKTAKEIAALLGVSARTVEFHKYKMMEALGLHSGAELVR